MKCPNCETEVETNFGVYQNLFILIPLVWVLDWLPINIEDGYTLNWGMIILLGLMITYYIYLVLYTFDKNKGTFMLINKRKTK